MTNLQLLRSLFTSPSAAFAELAKQPRFGLPLLLTVIATLLVQWVWCWGFS